MGQIIGNRQYGMPILDVHVRLEHAVRQQKGIDAAHIHGSQFGKRCVPQALHAMRRVLFNTRGWILPWIRRTASAG